MKWILIIVVIYFLFFRKSSGSASYQNQALMSATHARATVVLSNGIRTTEVFDLEDVRSTAKMPVRFSRSKLTHLP